MSASFSSGSPTTFDAGTIRGTILSMDSNSLTLRAEGSRARVNIDRSDVFRIQIQTSTRSGAAGNGAVVGGAIGLLLTAGLTLTVSLLGGGADGPLCSGAECFQLFVRIGLPAIGTGALVGAAVGYERGHDGWREVYPARSTTEMYRRGNASLRVGTVKGGGARIELRCSF